MDYCLQLAGDQPEQGRGHLVGGASEGLHGGGHGRRHHPIQHKKVLQGPLGEVVKQTLLLAHVLRCRPVVQVGAACEGWLPLEEVPRFVEVED